MENWGFSRRVASAPVCASCVVGRFVRRASRDVCTLYTVRLRLLRSFPPASAFVPLPHSFRFSPGPARGGPGERAPRGGAGRGARWRLSSFAPTTEFHTRELYENYIHYLFLAAGFLIATEGQSQQPISNPLQYAIPILQFA